MAELKNVYCMDLGTGTIDILLRDSSPERAPGSWDAPADSD